MSDSERYVPPPPPYELFLQHDQKVVDVQALDSEVLKARSFRDQLNDWALSDKTPRGVAIHTAPSTPKGPPRPASENIRVPRPLPPSPADTHLRGQASRFASVADTKLLAVQNDRATEPYVLAPPPFSATPLSLDEGAYGQSVYHPTPSVYSTPFHYPPQPSYGARRRNTDDRWRIPAYLPTESCTETLTSFRRSSHTSAQTPSSCLSQDDTFRARLAFDPSLAYGGSQVHSRTASPGMAAALYRSVALARGKRLFSDRRFLSSSAVSSHLQRDSATISGSRQYA